MISFVLVENIYLSVPSQIVQSGHDGDITVFVCVYLLISLGASEMHTDYLSFGLSGAFLFPSHPPLLSLGNTASNPDIFVSSSALSFQNLKCCVKCLGTRDLLFTPPGLFLSITNGAPFVLCFWMHLANEILGRESISRFLKLETQKWFLFHHYQTIQYSFKYQKNEQ